MRRLAAAVWALCAVGCGAEELRIWVDPSSVSLELAFLVELDPSGGPARSSALITESELELGPVLFAPELDEGSIVLITLTQDDIRPLDPRLDLARLGELSVLLPGKEATLGFAIHDLPSTARAYAVSEAAGEPSELVWSDAPFLQALELLVPIDPEFCKTEGTLVPFAEQAQILPPTLELPHEDDPLGARRLDWLTILDDRRVLGLSPWILFLFERDAGFDPESGGVLDLTSLAGVKALGSGLAADPVPRADGRRTVWVIGSVLDPLASGRLWEVAVGPDGLEAVGTTTRTPTGPLASFGAPTLNSVAVGPEGDVMLAGDGGYVGYRASGSSVFRRIVLPQEYGDLRAVRIMEAEMVNDPIYPHLFATDSGTIFQGNAVTGEWLPSYPHPYGGRLDSLVASVEGDDLWSAGRGGVILRKPPGGRWAAVEPVLSESFEPCATSSLGKLRLRDYIRSVAVDERFAYLAVESCNAVLAIYRAAECSTAFAAGPVERTREEIRDVVAGEAGVVVSQAYGLLHRLSFDP